MHLIIGFFDIGIGVLLLILAMKIAGYNHRLWLVITILGGIFLMFGTSMICYFLLGKLC